MGASLTVQLLEGHSVSRAGEAGEVVLRPDHVVLDGAVGRIALGGFARLGAERTRTDLMLTCLDGIGPHQGIGIGRELDRWADAARRAGSHLTEPGWAGCDPPYRERFAAPGKLVMTAGHGVPSAGALGSLALAIGGLEAAAALAGLPCHRERPPVLGIRLDGELSPWVSGFDLALGVARQAPPGWLRQGIAEFIGRGTASVTMGDRITAASQIVALGEHAALFPSDVRTRAFLAALGREPDWKPLEPAYDAAFDRELGLELGALEPLMASDEDPAGARAVRHALGMPLLRVVIGARAAYSDLARLARMLAGRTVPEGTELMVVPGSRAILEAAERTGVLETLIAAGARLVDSGLPPDVAWASNAAGAGLCTASSGEHRRGRRMPWYVASLETCAASALTGAIADPRAIEDLPAREARPVVTTGARFWVLEPLESAAAVPLAARNGVDPPLDGPLRAGVLLKLGDGVCASQMLPFGARQEMLLEDPRALGAYAFMALDPAFPERARRQRSGFVVTGRGCGEGEPGELAAIVLRALGVRAVLARSFAPGFASRLVHAGVLPLLIRHETDYREIAAGDELEIPGLPGALEPGRPLTVRNLTRARQHLLAHALDARRIAMLRDGGLIAAAAATLSRSPSSARVAARARG